MPLMTTDLVNILKMEFLTRCEINSSYSMRAYSKSLGVDQSLLSKIMRRQRRPSSEFTAKVMTKLDPETDNIGRSISGYMDIEHDYLEVISHWYYFAILEYLKIRPKADESEISIRLSIKKNEAKKALERLEEFQFIKLNKNKSWELLKFDNEWVCVSATNLAKKSIQKQMQAKSLSAIDQVSFQDRDHTSLTLACNRELVPEIRKKIKKFRRSLDAWVEKQGQRNDVYQLTVGFFPLTEKEK